MILSDDIVRVCLALNSNGDGTKITLCICDAGGDSRRLCFSGVEAEAGPK